MYICQGKKNMNGWEIQKHIYTQTMHQKRLNAQHVQAKDITKLCIESKKKIT